MYCNSCGRYVDSSFSTCPVCGADVHEPEYDLRSFFSELLREAHTVYMDKYFDFSSGAILVFDAVLDIGSVFKCDPWIFGDWLFRSV